MRTNELCFWLKGVFDTHETLSAKTVSIVNAQLADFSVGTSSSQNSFCNWLEGFLSGKDDGELSTADAQKVRERLAKVCDTVSSPPAPRPDPDVVERC